MVEVPLHSYIFNRDDIYGDHDNDNNAGDGYHHHHNHDRHQQQHHRRPCCYIFVLSMTTGASWRHRRQQVRQVAGPVCIAPAPAGDRLALAAVW